MRNGLLALSFSFFLFSCSDNGPAASTDSVRDSAVTRVPVDTAAGRDTAAATAAQPGAYTRIGAKDFSIELPAHMQQAKNLNRNASLQYMNAVRELYVVVLDESKSQVMQIIRDGGQFDEEGSVVQNYRMANLRMMNLPPETPANIYGESINGLPADIVELTATVNGIPTHYKFAFVEGKDRLYTVMSWTLVPQAEKNSPEMLRMLKSFQVGQ